jgi:nucleoside-diphosphate-sugar epimerase
MSFSKMVGRKISVLGGGWLGYPLAQTLSKLGSSVNISTRSQQRKDSFNKDVNTKNKASSSFLVDIENLSSDVTEFLNAEVLIVNITNKNIPAFAALIEKIEQSPIKHVMFISSTSVYPDNNSVISESDQLESDEHPLSQIEWLFKQSNSFDTTVIRFSGLIGYERHPGRFFRNGKTIKNAQAKVNLIHRDDCINIICQMINEDIWSEDFNVCSDTHPNKQEFYTHAAKSLGVEPAKCETGSIPEFKIIDNDKVKARLNYQFVYPDVMAIDFSRDVC